MLKWNEWTAAAFLFALILFVGYLNGKDIRDCEAKGHSTNYCYSVFTP